MTLLAHTRRLVCLAALLGLTACAWAPPPPASPVSARESVPAQTDAAWSNWGEGNPESSFREQIVQTAMAMMGTPYVYGGATPRGFDCSGLVQYSYQKAGINVPRTSRGQYRSAKPVPVAAAWNNGDEPAQTRRFVSGATSVCIWTRSAKAFVTELHAPATSMA